MASLLTSPTLSLHNLNHSHLPNQVSLLNSPISPSRLLSSSQSKLFLRPSKPRINPKLRVSASSPAPSLLPTPHPPNPTTPTPSIATILAVSLSITKLFAQAIQSLSSKLNQFSAAPTAGELAAIQNLQGSLACSAGPLFFAAMSSPGSLSTPLTVVASGMAKWLEIYSGVLLVRVLLSWFPNIPWDRQPLSAIRDLCDPYLNLFRNIIPPLFDTLDVSPLLAFAVLGTFSAILAGSR